MIATRPVRLALHLVCCARCSDLIPPDRAERAPNGEWRCTDWHACAYRRAVHRRIADALADAA